MLVIGAHSDCLFLLSVCTLQKTAVCVNAQRSPSSGKEPIDAVEDVDGVVHSLQAADRPGGRRIGGVVPWIRSCGIGGWWQRHSTLAQDEV